MRKVGVLLALIVSGFSVAFAQSGSVVTINSDKVLVDAELAKGDAVVIEGVQRLRDGGAVRIAGEQRQEKQNPPQGDQEQKVSEAEAAK